MSWYVYTLNVLNEGPPSPTPRAKPRSRAGWPTWSPASTRRAAWNAPGNIDLANYRLTTAICPAQVAADPTPGSPGQTNYIALGGLGLDTPSNRSDEAGPKAGAYRYRRADSGPPASRTASDRRPRSSKRTATSARGSRAGPSTLRGLDVADEPYLGLGRPFGGCHPGGAYVSMADGSVQFVKDTIDPGDLPGPAHHRRRARASSTSTARETPLADPAASIALAAVLAVGVPLFVRTPVWVDVTYHDVSAWNVLHGGVHYRDVFETNLPGMVWLHCLVRPVVGWSHEAIRMVDLVVIGGRRSAALRGF